MDYDNNGDIICSNISTTADHDSNLEHFKLEKSSDDNENKEDEYLVSNLKLFVHLNAIWW